MARRSMVAWCASTNCKNADSSPVRSKATRWSSSDTGGVAPTAPVEGLTPPTIQLNRAVNYYKANERQRRDRGDLGHEAPAGRGGSRTARQRPSAGAAA